MGGSVGADPRPATHVGLRIGAERLRMLQGRYKNSGFAHKGLR